jgi:hypothetical protein
MTAHVAECGVSGPKRDQLSQKLRPNLLSLKQFEKTYVLARWIRNLFMDIINRPSRHEADKVHSSSIDSRLASTIENHPTQASEVAAGQNSTGIAHTAYSDTEHSTHHARSQEGEDQSYFYDSNSYDAGTSPSVIMGNFVPNFITTEFLPPQHSGTDMQGNMNMIDFPSPSSLEYQSLHFLADLGLSGFSNYG